MRLSIVKDVNYFSKLSTFTLKFLTQRDAKLSNNYYSILLKFSKIVMHACIVGNKLVNRMAINFGNVSNARIANYSMKNKIISPSCFYCFRVDC